MIPAVLLSLLAVPPAPTASIDFTRDIQPILARHCAACHGFDATARKADLRLDQRASALATKAIVPGNAAASKLIARIESGDETEQMPPPESKRPLSAAQKKLLRAWIEQGATYVRHWAFVSPVAPPLPPVKNLTWSRNAIDAFVLHRLEREGLAPSPEADRATLLRRLALDLTGLPPTLSELDDFLADRSPHAYERVVDRLLGSPRHAERLALAWLDTARYADSNGFNNDEARTQWPWRDWVIDAVRRNLPYDRFVVEQIAGDLLPGATRDQKVASAFHRNQVYNTEGGIIPEEYRVEYVADRVHTTATVFLGLSMQCARCHDHKYDPISQREYYRFYAFFNSIVDRPPNTPNVGPGQPFVRVPSPDQAGRVAEIEAELVKPGIKADEANKLKAELAKLGPVLLVMEEMLKPRDTFLLKRGQYNQPGEKVAHGVPDVLPALPEDAPRNRLGLARWLVDPAHPLTARVAVNRTWEMLFGVGLVRTVEDFGTTGEPPSHPELLDHLATEFVRQGWDGRAMLRQIVTSATYRQSSRMTRDLIERDPENRLLARGARHRLPAEMVRDNALAVSGLLRDRLGGASVRPYQPPGLWEDVTVSRGGKYVPDQGPGLYRRSMYTFWKRTCPPPTLMSFDAPNREVCLPRRATTNTPLQALILLNDPTYIEAARALAERVLQDAGPTPEARIDLAYRRAIAREARPEEKRILRAMLDDALAHFRADPERAKRLLAVGDSPRDAKLDAIEHAAWTTVASTILNLDETISRR